MNRRIFTAFGGLCLLSLLAVPPVFSQDMDMGEAINQAGRQRMLTQRIVKAYAMIGQRVDAAAAGQQLNDAVALFEQQLDHLNQFAPSEQIKSDLDAVQLHWRPFKEMALRPAAREHAVELRELADATLSSAHQVVLSLQAVSGTNAGRLVNLAGRQRMLSQRLAALYLYRAWGIGQDSLEADYATASDEFGEALKVLIAASENTYQINKELKKVGDHWHLFQRSATLREGDYIPLLIERSSEKILEMMNNITGQYAAIADSGK